MPAGDIRPRSYNPGKRSADASIGRRLVHLLASSNNGRDNAFDLTELRGLDTALASTDSEAERLPLPLPPGRAQKLLPAETMWVDPPTPQQIAVVAVVTVLYRVLNHPY